MTFDWPQLVADLDRLLKLRTVPFGMKMFEDRAEMEAIPRIRRPGKVHTLDQVVGQASRLGWTVGITADDLAAFIPHQANMRIIDEMAKKLKLPESVIIARDIADAGNTSAASIPLATHRLLQENPQLSGGLALQIGFGAGLVFGAQVIVLP